MPAIIVAGGLATMFFSTGSTLGTNFNLVIRQLRMRPKLNVAKTSQVENSSPPLGLPERPPGS
jgi:hypothetical protein